MERLTKVMVKWCIIMCVNIEELKAIMILINQRCRLLLASKRKRKIKKKGRVNGNELVVKSKRTVYNA